MEQIEKYMYIFGVALGISESIALIPQLESNSILQLVINVLKKAKAILGK